MQTILLQQMDMNDLKSILDTHRQELKKEIEEILLNISQCSVLVPRNKLIKKCLTAQQVGSQKLLKAVKFPHFQLPKKDIFQNFQNKTKVLKK